MTAPIATYRLQLCPDFDFRQCADAAAYLSQLGVSHIYASPIFKARPGSGHGYDVCDPTVVNPELGGEKGFQNCLQTAKKHGLAWLQDIVPNHMAVTGHNPWLVDLLENGEASRYYDYFDIEWNHPLESIQGRMLAPFLGGFYGDTLENGEIRLGFDENGFYVSYYDLHFPLRMASYERILTHGLERLRDDMGRDDPDYVKLLGILYTVKGLPQEQALQERHYQIHFIKRMLHELCETSERIRRFIDASLAVFNGDSEEGEPANKSNRYDLLDALLSEQYFRLSFWKVAGEEINYRRFFSINDLISLRVEDEKVFRKTHELILDLVAKGDVAGLRVDHIDGLYDPSTYCKRLRENAPDAYLVVEKILMHEEPLPSFWPIQGTTGYDFTAAACNLFVPGEHEKDFDRIYASFIGQRRSLPKLISHNKRKIIDRHMAGDVENLARLVNRVSSRDRRGFDITMLSLKRAITELLINFPVYRTYISHDAFRPADLSYIRSAIRQTRRRNPELSSELDFLERFLILDFDESIREEDRRLWVQFVMRFQQFTGPLMAKGVEDTTLYVMNRLLCLNEVGSEASVFGMPPEEVHTFLQERGKLWPHTMNATASHDTKRGEDARMRLAALAEIPDAFQAALRRFNKVNARKRRPLDSGAEPVAPTRNDEFFLYQTLLATWPVDQAEMAAYPGRIRDYMIKAVREGKENSGWISPNEQYEEALLKFVDAVLKPGKTAFLREFSPLQQKTARFGMLYSLGQLLLKLTAPGVPDIYQGTEHWDLSLVDPDNRRPVDYTLRARNLDKMARAFAKKPGPLLRSLLETPQDARIKQFTLWRALQTRKENALLFRHGDYKPVAFSGANANRLFGFTRTFEGRTSLSILPRTVASMGKDGFPLANDWQNTHCTLELEKGTMLNNAFSGESVTLEGPETPVSVATLLWSYPLGLFVSETAA